MSELQHEIKNLIIDSLGLEDMSAEDIATDQPLFGDGLGLDSVDALELGLAIQKRFGIKIDAEDKDTRQHFANVANLAAFVSARQAFESAKTCKIVMKFLAPCATPLSSCLNSTQPTSAPRPTCIRTLKSIASTRST